MPVFSVIILTAAPPHQAVEAGGAFVKVDGRESLVRSVELFLNRDEIKQIQLVVLSDTLDEIKRRHGAHLQFSGVKIVCGGPRWVDQLVAAGGSISADATHVLVHDAARPAVPYTDLEAIMAEAEKHTAISLVTPSRTALVEIDEGGNALAFHPADQYMHVLTPQVFAKAVFEKMVLSRQLPHASEIMLLKGSPLNVRLSGSGDAGLAKAMMAMLPKPKRGPLGAFEEAQW